MTDRIEGGGEHQPERPAAEDDDRTDDPEQDPMDELVDEQGEESFPASDPPSNWAGEC